MRSFSVTARAFLYFIWFLGLTATIAVFRMPLRPENHPSLSGVTLAAILAVFAGARKVKVIRSPRLPEAGGMMSLGFLITFASLLAFGLRAGVFVGIVSGLSATLYPR